MTITGCGSDEQSPAATTSPTQAPKTFIASGNITVTASLVTDGTIGGRCEDNFKVIDNTTTVAVKDVKGALVATSTVTPGRTSDSASDSVLGVYATKCRFLFTIPAIPDDSVSYTLVVDGTDAGTFTRTELASPVSLTVADVFTPTFTKG